MNNRDLDQLLKSAGPPMRSNEYWDAFPQQVTAKLHWQPRAAGASAPASSRNPRFLAWGFGIATACVIAAFAIGFWRGHASALADPQLALAQKYFQEIEALFPNQVRAIVFDAQGPQLVLADKPDVPESTPYYVRICGSDGCQSFITFSGQQIQVNGEKCDVLADEKGRVMVMGKNRLWSEAGLSGSDRLLAKALRTTL